jgi:hypothetical protein
MKCDKYEVRKTQCAGRIKLLELQANGNFSGAFEMPPVPMAYKVLTLQLLSKPRLHAL